MNFPFYIAKRYLFSSGSTQAINIITGIAASAIIVGAMILFIVLSAFEGLKELHIEYTSVADPELKVFPLEGKFFPISDTQKKELSQIKGVIAFAEVLENQVLLGFKEKKLNATIKGVNKTYAKVIATDSILVYGDWLFDTDYNAVVGNQIANTLSLGINNYENPLKLFMPKPGKGLIANPTDAFKSKSVVVSGIYQLTNNLDQKYIFTSLATARELLNLDNSKVSHIELKLNKDADYDKISTSIENIFKNTVYTKNRIQLNDAMYKMLNTEHLAAYSLATLILIIALFNLIGSLIMMISDKKNNLQTLHKIGANLNSIRGLFFYLGMLITILSGLVGVVLGFIIIKLQQAFGLVMITPYLAYPTKLSFMNGVTVFATLFILGIIASSISSFSIKKEIIALKN